MEHKVTLSFGQPDGSKMKDIQGTFNDEEWVDLQNYVDYSDDLANIELLRSGAHGQWHIEYDKSKGTSFTTKLPPNDQVLAFLHRLRPFVLNNEPTYFNKIIKMLGKNLVDSDFRKCLKGLRLYYEGQRMQGMFSIMSDNVRINSDATLTKWLNAHEYHKDRDKQKELEDLHQIIPLEASRAVFIMMLYEKVKAIMFVAEMIEVLLGKKESFKGLLTE